MITGLIVAIVVSSDKENPALLFQVLFSFQKWKNFPFFNGILIVLIRIEKIKYLYFRLL